MNRRRKSNIVNPSSDCISPRGKAEDDDDDDDDQKQRRLFFTSICNKEALHEQQKLSLGHVVKSIIPPPLTQAIGGARDAAQP